MIVFVAAPDIIRWLFRIRIAKTDEAVLTRGWSR